MRIFRHRLNGDTANLIQRLFMNHRARSAKESETYIRYRPAPVQNSVSLGVLRKRPAKLRQTGPGRRNDAAFASSLQRFSSGEIPSPLSFAETMSAHGRNEDRHNRLFACFSALLMLPAWRVHAWRGQCNARQHVGQTDEMIRARRQAIRYSACPSASQCQAKRTVFLFDHIKARYRSVQNIHRRPLRISFGTAPKDDLTATPPKHPAAPAQSSVGFQTAESARTPD